jgi:Domain of unknown function (DUF6438)
MRLLIICGLLLASIHTEARHKKHQKEKTGPYMPVAVTIDYGACFGRCPIYQIELDVDGKVTYTGIRFAPDSGTYTRHITESEATRILKIAETYRMDTCQDRYQVRIPDIQAFSYKIAYKKSAKKILNASFGPVYLKELAAELDNIGQKKRYDDWVKIAAPLNY